MSDAPGIPGIVVRYWAAIGFFLLPISIAHTLFLSPTLAGAVSIAPGATEFVVLAALSWIVLYTAFTIQLFRVSDVESLRDFFENLTIDQQSVLVIFVVVFVNTVVILAAIAGVLAAAATAQPVGVAIAVAYPFFELRFSFTKPTPAKAVVGVTIAVAHALGTARNVTIERFMETLPGGKNPGPPATRVA